MMEVVCNQENNIVCKSHLKEICLDCKAEWREQNQIAQSIQALKELPPPNKPLASNTHNQVIALKIEGNKAYKDGRYKQAIEFYTSAVTLSWSRPLWEPLAFQIVREELAPTLSNRSAAYLWEAQAAEALVDAIMVTRLKSNWSKGWFRKGKALFALRRYNEAIQAYNQGLLFEEDSQDLIIALKEAHDCLSP